MVVANPTVYRQPPRFQLEQTLSALDVYLSDEQAAIYYEQSRLIQVTGGWRAGKSYVTALHLWARVLQGRLWWVVGPDYGSADAEYSYLVQWAIESELYHSHTTRREESNELILNLSYEGQPIRIVTKSARHPERLGSVAPDGVYMVEAAQHAVEAYFQLIGRTAERRALLFFSGTLEGASGWYADFHTDNEAGYGEFYDSEAVTIALPSWANRVIYPEGANDPEIQRQKRLLPPEVFEEKYAGKRTMPAHRVLKEFSVERNCGVPPWGPGLDTNRSVELWIDPGIAHPHAVLAVQFHGRTAWVVDIVYMKERTCQQVIDVCKKRAWWKLVDYWVMDIAGRNRNAAGTSYWQIWSSNLPGVPARATKVTLVSGYDRHRECLLADEGDPKLMFLEKHCGPILIEYGKHVYKTLPDGTVISEQPVDLWNDAIKAATYGLWDHWGPVTRGSSQASAKVQFGKFKTRNNEIPIWDHRRRSRSRATS